MLPDSPRVRYYIRQRRRSLWQTFLWFWKTLEWKRTEIEYVPVYPGDPGYEDAPFEATVIYDKAEMERLQRLWDRAV